MSPDATKDRRRTMEGDFCSHISFVFPKAVAKHPLAGRQLLPYRDADVTRTKDLSRLGGVNHFAARIRTETVRHDVEVGERLARQQRLDRRQIDSHGSPVA
jgi:hypothetical protein